MLTLQKPLKKRWCCPFLGESRTLDSAIDLRKLIPELLDRLIELGEISRQIKLTIGGNGSSNSGKMHINLLNNYGTEVRQ